MQPHNLNTVIKETIDVDVPRSDGQEEKETVPVRLSAHARVELMYNLGLQQEKQEEDELGVNPRGSAVRVVFRYPKEAFEGAEYPKV